jgi:hypothetical protein
MPLAGNSTYPSRKIPKNLILQWILCGNSMSKLSLTQNQTQTLKQYYMSKTALHNGSQSGETAKFHG